MRRVDPNKIVFFVGLTMLLLVTGAFGYRLEISPGGLRFEGPKAPALIERPG